MARTAPLFPLSRRASRVWVRRRFWPGSGSASSRLYPITREGLKCAFRYALPIAKIDNYRLHDNRHTAATRVLRAGGNLKVVQNLLWRENIATTAKYAHAVQDDVTAAMQKAAEAATATPSPTKSSTDDVEDSVKRLTGNAKLA